MDELVGMVAVTVGGLLIGSGLWPYKLMRSYQFEHWWLIASVVCLLVAPWTITLVACPRVFSALCAVPASILVKANVFSLAWGIANVLSGLCCLRIGVALTGAILAGLGVSVGSVTPMIFKGSGIFRAAPDLGSASGWFVVAGVVAMLVGVTLAAVAGMGRQRQLQAASDNPMGRPSVGIIMAAIAGVLSAGMSLSFVYSQGSVVEALTARGASELAANVAVWAVALLAGALFNIGYAIYSLARNRSWEVLLHSPRDAGLALILALNSLVAIVMMGKGMRLLGALGASVGFGIQQAMQMTGGQALGFISGEWRGVRGTPRRQMYLAIGVLMIAAMIMAYGRQFSAT